ncbi:MAG: NHLP leader peptide family RiPP precursor [Bacteroidia bacterium]|nr:NHLP leader peptide family RiPP precursor [Bacteroidia bacterium]
MRLSKNQQILSKVLEKVWEDEEFKNRLIQDPTKVIRENFGETLDLPAGKTLAVVDQTDSSKFYLNLPPEPNMDEIELTDEQLELIAGGGSDAQVAASAQNI